MPTRNGASTMSRATKNNFRPKVPKKARENMDLRESTQIENNSLCDYEYICRSSKFV
jgi:hypothetical protein